MTRVAVLGCGRIARISHLGIRSRMPNVEIVAVAEADDAA